MTDDWNHAGYPRPLVYHVNIAADARDKMPKIGHFPAPWINGDHAKSGDFYSFRDDAMRAVTESLCCMCGTALRGVVAVGISVRERKPVSYGGWCHPKCLRLAVSLCPHYSDSEPETVVAHLHVGDGPGVEPDPEALSGAIPLAGTTPLTMAELRDLAVSNPWGVA